MRNLIHSSFLLVILFCTSCETESIPPQNNRLGLTFFPLEVGNYAIYDVQDIRYVFGQAPDTLRYQLKEIVADSMPGHSMPQQTQEITYRLERYSKTVVDSVWWLDSVWTARKNTGRVVVVENNVPFVKLVFPCRPDIEWDGNVLNSRPEQQYTLTTTSRKLNNEMAGRSPLDSLFGSSLTVIEIQSADTIIADTRKSESYVDGIGLIYKKSLTLQYCASDASCVGLGIIEFGWDYQQILVAHGKESP